MSYSLPIDAEWKEKLENQSKETSKEHLSEINSLKNAHKIEIEV